MSGDKRKRVRTPAVRRDPVLAALVAKIPGEGATFTRAQRVNLLRMFAMAFDGAFGVELPIGIDAALEVTHSGGPIEMPNILPPAAPPQPIFAPAEADEIRYFVDASGFARMEPGGGRIRPVDIPAGAELEDEREGDDSLDTINWADGKWPPGAYPNPITIVKA
ncbi:hypothetical protein [Bradyrhizobium sp. 188]|uniref:hypothetical protein n=1 Tax=Bradyrhizobium sp. 188 TaxID=2782656 RepID=UPI001FF71104|nr:hypothetical protein [Bradyrhizobium sp. 188]MCK1501492.1 hypothetical protein [Bradyrhizobium sp. 188]